jgi:putative CocE/NonD family hydrolase
MNILESAMKLRVRRLACYGFTASLLAWHIAYAGDVSFQWGVKIPLRDGVKLNATLYRPAGQSGPAPCIFTLTPYIAQTYHDRGMYFAGHGYPFLTVDVRGRGNSEGVFRPLIQEAHDGFDVVEWLAKQPYCNGKISMWGGSYAGYDQWATAKERPPHLATIVPVAAPYIGADFPSTNRIFVTYVVQWLTYVSGHAAQDKIFGDSDFWSAAFRKWLKSGAAFKTLDSAVGNPSPIFQEWVSHPDQDAYWDAYNPTREDYAKLGIPILTITGMYDGDQQGALTHYRNYMSSATPAGRARHLLVIGPWDHAGTRTPKADVGGLTFGPASLVDLPQLHLDWYAWTMQGGKRPDFLKKPVMYYVTGGETWRAADSLDAITAEMRPYYLASYGSGARDVLNGGSLVPAKADANSAGIDSYSYDPSDTSVTSLEAADTSDAYLTDQRMVYALNGRELVYHTPMLDKDTEMSGFPRLSAWLEIDQPDTDFTVSLYEILADGSSVLLSSDVMRARYRRGERNPEPVALHTPLLYDFNSFTFMSRQVRKGSRLRLVFGPADSSSFERNFNAGGVVADETAKDARKVVVGLFHDQAHPSVLYIPVGATAGAAH